MKLTLLIPNLLLLTSFAAYADKVVISRAELVVSFKELFKLDLSKGSKTIEFKENQLKGLLTELTYEEGKFSRGKFVKELKEHATFFQSSSAEVKWLPSFIEGEKELSNTQLVAVVRMSRVLKANIQRQLEEANSED